MTVYLRHLDKTAEPPEERWYPYETIEEAQAQAKHDLARNQPVEGVYAGPDASTDKLLTKAKLK